MLPRLALISLLLSFSSLSLASPTNSQVALKVNDTFRIAEKWNYVNCGLPTDPIQIDSIVVTPDPPKPGQNLTVKVKATVTEVIEEGAYADVTVKLGLIKLLTKQFDVCEEARKAEATVRCPVQPGSYDVEQTVKLPKEIPQAKFVVNVRGFTAEDDDMVCLDLHVDFMKLPFPRLRIGQ